MSLLNVFAPDERSKRSRKTQLVDFFIGVLLCLSIGETVVILLFFLTLFALGHWLFGKFGMPNGSVFEAFIGLHSVLFIISFLYGLWFARQRQNIQALPLGQQRKHIIRGLILVGLGTCLLGILLILPVQILASFIDTYLTYSGIRGIAEHIVFILLLGIVSYFTLGTWASGYLMKTVPQNNQVYTKKAFTLLYFSLFFAFTAVLNFLFLFTGYTLLFYSIHIFYLYGYVALQSIFLLSGSTFLFFTKKDSSKIIKTLCIMLTTAGCVVFISMIIRLFFIEKFMMHAVFMSNVLVFYGVYVSTLCFFTYHRLFSNHETISTNTTTK